MEMCMGFCFALIFMRIGFYVFLRNRQFALSWHEYKHAKIQSIAANVYGKYAIKKKTNRHHES